MQLFRRSIAFTFIIVFVPLPLRADDVLPRSEVDRLVKPIIDGRWSKGLVVGLINEHDRQIIGYGIKSDSDTAVPDGQTVFEIGSVSKTFTATLLALGVTRGEFQLDDPLQKLLPGVKLPHGKGDRPITLVQLSTHSSGLPRLPGNFFPADQGNPYADYTARQMFDYLALLNLPCEPGERCEYSNFAVGLLGEALARHAGKNYEYLLLEEICKPLKLASTRITLDETMRRRLAMPYDVDGNPLKNWDLGILAGAGGIRSTTDDMLTYVAAQIGLTKSDVSPAIELTHKRQREFDKYADIALNWFIMKKDGLYFHNGQTGGYHTSVDFDVNKRIGVVVFSTTSSYVPDAVAVGLMRRLLGEKVDPPSLRRELAVDRSVLDRYVGEYKLGTLSWVTIQKIGDHLTARLTGQSAIRIYPESETKFFWKAVNAQVTFDIDTSGKVTGLTLHQFGKNVPAEKTK